MASLLIRNLDDKVKERLRAQAARNGRSMEEEARLILRLGVAVHRNRKGGTGLGTRLHEIAMRFGGFDLELPPREPARPAPDFSGPEYAHLDGES